MSVKFMETMNTETVEIKKSNLEAADRQADKEPQKLPGDLFRDAITDGHAITERIKTIEDACRELGENHPLVQQYHYWMREAPIFDGSEKDLITYLKLRIITAALNEGWTPQFTEDEKRYYPCFSLYIGDEIDKMGDIGKAYRQMTSTEDYRTEYAGFAYGFTDDAPWPSDASVASRLCLRTIDLASYCGRQFIRLWADFTLILK